MTRLRWAFHNIVAHPIAGVCWLFGLDRSGDWLHDVTIPPPAKESTT